jgi:hypothetical protein
MPGVEPDRSDQSELNLPRKSTLVSRRSRSRDICIDVRPNEIEMGLHLVAARRIGYSERLFSLQVSVQVNVQDRLGQIEWPESRSNSILSPFRLDSRDNSRNL